MGMVMPFREGPEQMHPGEVAKAATLGRGRKTPPTVTAPALLWPVPGGGPGHVAGGPAHSSQKPARAGGFPLAAVAAMAGEPPPVEERRRLQEELAGFVESCGRTLEEVTSSLGWSLDLLDPGEEAAAEVRGAGPGRPDPAVLWRPRPRPRGAAGGGRGSPARRRPLGPRDELGAAHLLDLRV